MSFFNASKIPITISNQEYWDFRNAHPDWGNELVKTNVSAAAIYKNYTQKGVYYIQIGGGFGFYHLESDPIGLGVPKFVPGKVQVRSRLKWGGSSAGVLSWNSADPVKAADPAVANKRATVSWNNGLTIGEVPASTFNLDGDLGWLKLNPHLPASPATPGKTGMGNPQPLDMPRIRDNRYRPGNTLSEVKKKNITETTLRKTIKSLLLEELTKKDVEKIAKDTARKEIIRVVGNDFAKSIQDEIKKALGQKATKQQVADISKEVLKKLYREMSHSYNPLIDRIKL
jgi:hypothetical protein